MSEKRKVSEEIAMKKFAFLFLAVFFFVCPRVSSQTRSQIFTQNLGELAEFFNNRGDEYFNNGDYDSAIEDYTRTILLDPNYKDAYGNRGNAYYFKSDYNSAIEDWSRTILLDPENAVLYSNRGYAYFNIGEYGKSIENFTQVIRLDPDNAERYYNRGYVYLCIGECDKSIEDFTKAILINPDYAVAYFNRGDAYFVKDEYDSAIEDYTHAIRLEPNNASFYSNRGEAYYATRDNDRAIENYTSAIQLNPDYAAAYSNRGDAYMSKGSYDLAIEDYTHAIRLNPNGKNVYFNRGAAYVNIEEYDSAINDFAHTILLDPNDVLAYSALGASYALKGEYDPAIECYTQAIRINPNDAYPYAYRGHSYEAKGEYDLAIEDYTQAILLDPKFVFAYYRRGIAYLDKGDYDRAIEGETQVILLNPNYTEAYNIRGRSYMIKGENDKAIEDYTQAILLSPNNASAYGNRGIAHSNQGEYEKAIADHTQAIRINPNFVQAYNNRGFEYNDKGEYDLAIEDYTQAIRLSPNAAYLYRNRGNAYGGKGEYELAAADHQKVFDIAENAANLNEIFLYTMLYADETYTGHPYLSREYEKPLTKTYIALTMDGIARSVQRAEQARSTMGARGSAIMTQTLYFYYMGLDLESQYGTPEKAFAYSESLRSRGFLDQLGTEAALRLPGISDEERERVRYLLSEIENRQNVLEAFRERQPETEEEQRSLVSAGQTLSVLEAELAALDKTISDRIPQYAELRSPVPANLKQAQTWLADETAVLIYALWDDSLDFTPYTGKLSRSFDRPAVNSYCLVLTKDGLTAVTLDHEFSYMQAINRLRTNIMRRNRIGTMERDRNDLYDALIKPALPHIPANIKNLIIVPDGTLGHLPFDILREDSDSPDLGETYRLSLSPSVSVSMLSEKTSRLNLPILAFGGAWYDREKTAVERGAQRSVSYGDEPNQIAWHDLPGTEEEVQRLTKLVKSAKDIRVIQGGDVSEEQVKKLSADGELAKYPILHFATHGYFKDYDLERAGIVLSEVSGLLDNGENGYLTIPEIAVLNLNARLVLLSACETGLGVLRRGDGMVGMVRAFLLAGAEYLGVSLWEVNDEVTLEFMTLLYTKVLNEGMPFKEAYYLIKNEFRHHEEWDHPNYWAAFVLYE